MNKLNSKTLILTVLTISLSIFSYAQKKQGKMDMKHADGKMMKMNHNEGGMMKHKDMTMTVMLNNLNLNKAYMHYTMISKALVKADAKKAQMVSNMLASILKNYKKTSKAFSVAGKLAKADKLEEQRKLFADLTVAFEPLLKGHISKGVIYKNYCPMANGKDAYWFSNSKKNVNPYMGGTMPSCGSVKEVLKSI